MGKPFEPSSRTFINGCELFWTNLSTIISNLDLSKMSRGSAQEKDELEIINIDTVIHAIWFIYMIF